MGYNATTNSFTNILDLQGQVGTDFVTVNVTGGTVLNDGNGGMYFWDPLSITSHDGVKVIQVSGVPTGRWMRSKNNNYTTGEFSFGVVALTSTYTVTHGLGYAPTSIQLQPLTAAAAGSPIFIPKASINSTTFQVTFTGLLNIGTATFSFIAIR